jgi:hypothetical protein
MHRVHEKCIQNLSKKNRRTEKTCGNLTIERGKYDNILKKYGLYLLFIPLLMYVFIYIFICLFVVTLTTLSNYSDFTASSRREVSE